MVQLCLGGLWLRTVETAEEAARFVYEQKTGLHEWDTLTEIEAPSDLSGWETI